MKKIILVMVFSLNIFAQGMEEFEKVLKECTVNNNYAMCNEIGLWSEQNKNNSNARMYYTIACIGKASSGCYNLGRLYRYGVGGKKDIQKTFQLYTEACNLNSPKACAGLATLYDAGQGVRRNRNKATELFEKSCKLGYYNACEVLK